MDRFEGVHALGEVVAALSEVVQLFEFGLDAADATLEVIALLTQLGKHLVFDPFEVRRGVFLALFRPLDRLLVDRLAEFVSALATLAEVFATLAVHLCERLALLAEPVPRVDFLGPRIDQRFDAVEPVAPVVEGVEVRFERIDRLRDLLGPLGLRRRGLAFLLGLRVEFRGGLALFFGGLAATLDRLLAVGDAFVHEVESVAPGTRAGLDLDERLGRLDGRRARLDCRFERFAVGLQRLDRGLALADGVDVG